MWNERADRCKLSSDFHMFIIAHVPTYMHAYKHKLYNIYINVIKTLKRG